MIGGFSCDPSLTLGTSTRGSSPSEELTSNLGTAASGIAAMVGAPVGAIRLAGAALTAFSSLVGSAILYWLRTGISLGGCFVRLATTCDSSVLVGRSTSRIGIAPSSLWGGSVEMAGVSSTIGCAAPLFPLISTARTIKGLGRRSPCGGNTGSDTVSLAGLGEVSDTVSGALSGSVMKSGKAAATLTRSVLGFRCVWRISG